MTEGRTALGRGEGAPLWFLFFSVCCQIGAFGLGILLRDFLPNTVEPSLFVAIVAVVHGILALTIASFLGLPRAWRYANALLGPAVALSLNFTIPPALIVTIAIAALLMYLPTIWTRVPFYPTSSPAYEIIRAKLPTDRPFVFIDLGCGFGTLLAYLAKRCPQGTFIGVELGPLPYLLAKFRSFLAHRRNLKIEYQDLWRSDISRADFVYVFLAPPPMAALWQKVQRELPKGRTLIVNSFPVPAKAREEIELLDSRNGKLYWYTT